LSRFEAHDLWFNKQKRGFVIGFVIGFVHLLSCRTSKSHWKMAAELADKRIVQRKGPNWWLLSCLIWGPVM